MSEEHTPGPWVIVKYEYGATGIRQHPQAPSVSCGESVLAAGFAIATLVDNGDSTAANARLRALNAELVGLCEMALELLPLACKCPNNGGGDCDCCVLERELQLTIAKAKAEGV